MNLDELERLLAEATPGPWTITRYEQGGGRIFRENTLIADLFQEADREYIAAVLTEAPALIAAARRAEELEKALDRIVTEPQGSVRASIPYFEEGAPR